MTKFFGSDGCAPPKNLSGNIIKRNGHCLLSENKIQDLTSRKDSRCAACCFYKIYLAKNLGIDFKSAASKIYYQRFFSIDDITETVITLLYVLHKLDNLHPFKIEILNQRLERRMLLIRKFPQYDNKNLKTVSRWGFRYFK